MKSGNRKLSIRLPEESNRRARGSGGTPRPGLLKNLESVGVELRRPEEELAAGAEDRTRLAAIVECSDDAILSQELDGTIRTWNRAAERLFGYAAAEVIGKPITLLIPANRIDEEKQIINRLRRGRRVDRYESVRFHKDGFAVDVSISACPIRDARGRITEVCKIVRDLTGMKRSAAALSENEERIRAIIETAVDAIITIDERGIIESANSATERMFGYSRSEMLGQNVKLLMPEPYRREHDGYLHSYLKTGRARIIGIGREVTALRKDGTTFPMSLSVSEVALGNRRLFTGMIHDLSSRRQLERQIVEATTNEQRRIGQDLHDGLCQDLIGIAFAADIAARQLRDGPPPESDALERIATSIREAAFHARQLSHGLNPIDPKAGGLPTALESLARRISETFHLSCTFEWDRKTRVQDDSTATHIYRIAQEAVSNAVKHGHATEIAIRLFNADGALNLIVNDNGRGFPESVLQRAGTDGTLEDSAPVEGIGLHSMKYRAHMVGGTFDICPRAEGGTTVNCSIRLSSPARSRASHKPKNATTSKRGGARPSRNAIPIGHSPKQGRQDL